MEIVGAEAHYDALIREGHDPANDPPILARHMDKWDGEPFIDALALSGTSRVLEIGVGTGRLAKRVLAAGCGHFTGIDLSAPTIRRAQQNLGSWHNVSLIWGDFMAHGFPDPFDVVYCSLTLFHIADKRRFAGKVEALARQRFVASIPKQRECSLHYGGRMIPLFPDDAEEFGAMLMDAGFGTLHMVEVEFARIVVAEKQRAVNE